MCRILFPERDRALQVLRQSDCVWKVNGSREDIQREKRLLQASAHNEDVPFCVVESIHGVLRKSRVARKN
jgi:hypothetical protein